jgi:hypothetical protein
VAGSLVCGRGLANPGQPPFAVTEMCKLLCQFPPIILHISDLGCRFPPVAAPVSTCDRLRDLSVQPGTHGAEKFRPHCTQFRFTAGISEAVHTRRGVWSTPYDSSTVFGIFPNLPGCHVGMLLCFLASPLSSARPTRIVRLSCRHRTHLRPSRSRRSLRRDPMRRRSMRAFSRFLQPLFAPGGASLP